MFLTEQEIITLTGKKRRGAQRRVLLFMGVEHKTRPDGSLIILAKHVEKVLDGVLARAKTSEVDLPNWNALK